MKSLIAYAVPLVLLTQSAFADGTSFGPNASFGANFVRRPDVVKCIKDVEKDNKASSYVSDIRKVDENNYEIGLTLLQLDIARGSVDLALSMKKEEGAFGQPVYVFECSVKK